MVVLTCFLSFNVNRLLSSGAPILALKLGGWGFGLEVSPILVGYDPVVVIGVSEGFDREGAEVGVLSKDRLGSTFKVVS